jgi:hypothetical protein
MADSHRWTFKSRLRSRTFGWRGSKTAIARLKEALSEIKAVNGHDSVVAGEGAIVLMERLWPAFQDIDTSSGALGSAVNAALAEIIPILIAAPATPKVRAVWLERLYDAVQEDGVQYLYPAEQRWGEIAVYPELMNAYADLCSRSCAASGAPSRPTTTSTSPATRSACRACWRRAATKSCWISLQMPATASGPISASVRKP